MFANKSNKLRNAILLTLYFLPLQQSCWSGFYGYRLWYPTIGWFWNSGYLTSGSLNFWRKLSRPPDPPGICGSGIQPSVINWLFNFWISELLAETLPALAALISWLRLETMKSVITPFSFFFFFLEALPYHHTFCTMSSGLESPTNRPRIAFILFRRQTWQIVTGEVNLGIFLLQSIRSG